jgi:PIN domain nuclease of toxin-antitoxin system
MIILDTHIWIWWVNEDEQLPSDLKDLIEQHIATGLGVSAISCWEVAKLVERGRLELTLPVKQWIAEALAYPGVRLLEMSPDIAVDSTQLPGKFHRDPADQIIVATARAYDTLLLTLDTKILNYEHVQTSQKKRQTNHDDDTTL